MRGVVLFVIAVAMACSCNASAADEIVVTPSTIFVNTSTINATLRLFPAAPFTQMFLMHRDFTDCSNPPSITNEYVRTHVYTLNLDRKVNFPVWKLRSGLYFVCFRNATLVPNGRRNVTHLGNRLVMRQRVVSRYNFQHQSKPGLKTYQWHNRTSNRTVNLTRVVTTNYTTNHTYNHTYNETVYVPTNYSSYITEYVPVYGVGSFRNLRAMVTIARPNECTGGKFGICKITPTTVSGRAGNTTLSLFYARPGTQAFLMKPKRFGVAMYNCTKPPPTESGMRSPVATIKVGSTVTFETFGLEAGTYIVCYKNNTFFSRLDPTVVVSGPIDAARSTVSCCAGPFLVGQKTFCQINTVDSLGNPAGGPADACELRVCPLTDGRGNDITNYVEPYFVSTGLFEFYFTAQGSGCGASASASFKGRTLGGNKINFFTLQPTIVDPTKATSECSWAAGVTQCNVTKRDFFGNPVSACHVTSTGTMYCKPTVQA